MPVITRHTFLLVLGCVDEPQIQKQLLIFTGDMHLSLSLPRVEAVDLRPWVPPEHALVISSEHTNPDSSYKNAQQAKNVAWPPPVNSPAHLMKPSFLTMEFSAQPRLAKQKVGGRKVIV